MRLVVVRGLATAMFFWSSSALAHDIQREIYETKYDLTIVSDANLEESGEGKLKEIVIWGLHILEDHREIENIGEWYRVVGDPHRGELGSDDRPQFRVREERYGGSEKIFCFRESSEEEREKHTVFDPNMRVRLYDEADNVVSEDFMRSNAYDFDEPGPYGRGVISYIPYRGEGHKLKIVRLESEEEVVIATLTFYTLQELREDSQYPLGYSLSGDCYVPPGW